MENMTFKALVVRETADGSFVRSIEKKSIGDLPAGDVLIRVSYSSLNYKDALSATGNRGVTRSYPHTPGIDAAGIVVSSRDDTFTPGESVLVTGYDLGMNTDGGFSKYIRVPSDWVVPIPEYLTERESMIYGTAGFTAALSVYKLTGNAVTPDQGPVLVTGATGGVGSTAVGILSGIGYKVAAVTGKSDSSQYLKDLGAVEIIPKQEAIDTSGRPLLKARWAGVIDTVGGDILSSAIRSTRYGGTVTCCGNVASADLNITVFPFILRGVSLLGIDSVNCPKRLRLSLWEKLSNEWKLDQLEQMTTQISLEELDPYMDRILEGRITGRTVVKVSD